MLSSITTKLTFVKIFTIIALSIAAISCVPTNRGEGKVNHGYFIVEKKFIMKGSHYITVVDSLGEEASGGISDSMYDKVKVGDTIRR